MDRGLWAEPDPALIAELQQVYLDVEGDLEDAWYAVAATDDAAVNAFMARFRRAVMDKDRVLASYGNPPADNYLVALAQGAASSPAVASGLSGPDDLAAAPLATRGAVLLVGRTGNEFRERERAQLLALARIADHVWRRLDAGPPKVGRHPVGATAG